MNVQMNVRRNRGNFPYKNGYGEPRKIQKKNQENGCGTLTLQPRITEKLKAGEFEVGNYCTT